MTRRQRRLKRVSWDGPNPRQGDFLATQRAGLFWRIETVTVHRATDSQGRTLSLAMLRHDGEAPKGAVVHPPARVQPTDPKGPDRTRQLAGSGPTAVMKAHWRDPTDTVPNASRRPRQVTGYRTYCPLRRMKAMRGSQITEAQIAAADVLRGKIDLAAIGASAVREEGGTGYGPKLGPSALAILQAQASQDVKRVLARFAPVQRIMLTEIVLLNRSLAAWVATQSPPPPKRPLDPDVEMGKLLSILDVLVDHFDSDVRKTLASEAPIGAT